MNAPLPAKGTAWLCGRIVVAEIKARIAGRGEKRGAHRLRLPGDHSSGGPSVEGSLAGPTFDQFLNVFTKKLRELHPSFLDRDEWERQKLAREGLMKEKGIRPSDANPFQGVEGGYMEFLDAHYFDPAKLKKLIKYCWDKDRKPSRQILKNCIRSKGPTLHGLPEVLERFLHAMENAFGLAMEELRILEHGDAERYREPSEEGRSPKEGKEFSPGAYGGKELCLVVSYFKHGQHNPERLAKILTYKGGVRYQKKHRTPLEWYGKNRNGFRQHIYKLRRKARQNGWWDNVPTNYYCKYS